MAIDKYGQIIRRAPRPIPVSTNSRVDFQPVTSSRSFHPWNAFDNVISSIGNWIVEYWDGIASVLTIIFAIVLAIPILIGLFSLEPIWMILAIIFLGSIVVGLFSLAIEIFAVVCNLAIGLIRWIFWNGWTFLLAVAIAIGVCIYSGVIDVPGLWASTEAWFRSLFK